MHNPDYRSAKLRYAAFRREAYSLARRGAMARVACGDLRLADIDLRALRTWKGTWTTPHPSGGGGWDWALLLDQVRTDPSALKVALWCENILCGMAIGGLSTRTASGQRRRISIHYLESHPDRGHPLKGSVAPILIDTAEYYGSSFGATVIRLIDPQPGVVNRYMQMGFEVVRTPSGLLYCEKEILR